jgi:choline dehydrogenase
MHYDHTVLGAGSAGTIVAARLSEDPERSALLVEAGPDHPDFAQLPDELKLSARYAGTSTSIHNWQYLERGTVTAPVIPILGPVRRPEPGVP